MDSELIWTLVLLPVGFLTGIMNVLAGGGSFITLPVLIATGLPVSVANGTNRISVIVQGLLATASYHKKGQFDAKLYKKLLPPILAGSLIGAWLATQIEPEKLKTVFGVMFLLMAGFLMVRSRLKKKASDKLHPWRYPALFAVGIYGGFIQAGVGLWILLTSTGMFAADAVKANSVKLPLTLTFTIPALIIFLNAGLVEWIPGLVLAVGNIGGTILGVKLSIKGGAPLIFKAVTVILVLTGIRLLVP